MNAHDYYNYDFYYVTHVYIQLYTIYIIHTSGIYMIYICIYIMCVYIYTYTYTDLLQDLKLNYQLRPQDQYKTKKFAFKTKTAPYQDCGPQDQNFRRYDKNQDF